MQREKGVLTKPCPGCSMELGLVSQADGSSAYDSCAKCYPTTEKVAPTPVLTPPLEVASKAVVVPPREVGTRKPEEDA